MSSIKHKSHSLSLNCLWFNTSQENCHLLCTPLTKASGMCAYSYTTTVYLIPAGHSQPIVCFDVFCRLVEHKIHINSFHMVLVSTNKASSKNLPSVILTSYSCCVYDFATSAIHVDVVLSIVFDKSKVFVYGCLYFERSKMIFTILFWASFLYEND